MSGGPFLDYVDPWINWDWLSSHVLYVLSAVEQHLQLTVIAVVLGLVISLPLGVVAQRYTTVRIPTLIGLNVFYTIPSIALFAFLVPYTGLSGLSAEIPLVGYNVLVLTRNVIVGLDAVPADVLDAADGMGYRRLARLLRVELPLALPAIFAGLRVATVSTIGIVTIAALIGIGGLGQLILRGLIENFHTPLVVATVLSIVLAFVADMLLFVTQRISVPWARTA
ncbi:MAG TPA: ABC transporter permease [Candidatus Dormibacteraeota bacterium]|nr:ABC transporter permease [Candidatus Dormibacteraeota bacterium]